MESKLSIGDWISNEFRSLKPTEEVAFRAFRNLSKETCNNLSSDIIWVKQGAIGQWYESVIYECLIDLARRNSNYSLVAKNADVPKSIRTPHHQSQDGLFYDENGNIVVRGNGEELGEFDFLLVDGQNQIAFIEAKNSKRFLKNFEQTITYKKRVLNKLFSVEAQFILVSSINLRDAPKFKRVVNLSNSFFVNTPWFYNLQSCLSSKEMVENYEQTRDEGPKFLQVSDLKTRKIHYLKVYNSCRQKIIDAVMNGQDPELPTNAWLLQRVIVGYLSKASVAKLLQEKSFIVEGKRLTVENLRPFSEIVLSLSMPEFRPVFYLKLISNEVYWKYGPSTTATFEFERNILFHRTAFFNWLTKTDYPVEPDLMTKILSRYLTETVVGSKRKIREIPKYNSHF